MFKKKTMPVRCQNEHNLSFLTNFVQDSKVACLIRVLRTNITPDPHPDSGVIFTIVYTKYTKRISLRNIQRFTALGFLCKTLLFVETMNIFNRSYLYILYLCCKWCRQIYEKKPYAVSHNILTFITTIPQCLNRNLSQDIQKDYF